MESLYEFDVQTPETEFTQEIEDVALIQDFKFKLNKRGYKLYDREQINDLIRDYRTNHNQLSLIKLYKMHEPLFKNAANKYWYLQAQGVMYESEMNIAFLQAIENYDVDNEYGAHFNTFFKSCVTNRIRVMVNHERALKRKSNYDGLSFDENFSKGEDKDTSFGDIVEDYRSTYMFSKMENNEIYQKACSYLTPVEQQVLQGIKDGIDVKQIAKELNIKVKEVNTIISSLRQNKVFLNALKEMYTMCKTTFTIIDGTNLACRAMLAVDPENDLSVGELRTGHIYRFMKMFIKIIEKTNPTHIVVCWDVDRNTWRKEKFDAYKANRGESFTREKVSFQYIKDILEAIGVLNVEYNGYEGDDLCGTFANLSTANKTYVVSGDRDIFQLVQPTVDVLYISNKEHQIVNSNYIQYNYEIEPKDFVFLKTLVGDKGDNIPGINGVAEKSASKLIKKFGTLNNLLKHYNNKEYTLTAKQIDAIKQWKDNALLYNELVTIKTNVPIEYDMEDCKTTLNWANAKNIFEKLHFNSFIKNINSLPIGGANNE